MPYCNYKKLFLFKISRLILKINDEAINLIQKADLNKKKVYMKSSIKRKKWKIRNYKNYQKF